MSTRPQARSASRARPPGKGEGPGNPSHAHTAHGPERVKGNPRAQAQSHGPVHNRPVLRGK